MRLRVATLMAVAGLALTGCSLSDDEEPASDAASTVTVTETVTAPGSEDRRSREAADEKKSKKVGGRRSTAGSKPGSSKPSGGAETTSESTPEHTLAVIDAENASVPRRLVRRYAGLLDRLEGDCDESRAQLAEAALTASHDVETETNQKLSILAVLREVAAAEPSGTCADAFTRVRERHT